jgi:hypothetical protein
MERLTKYLASGAATYDYPVDCYSGVDCNDRVAKSVYRQLCVERLATYEDTGLTPEEIKSMKDEHFSGLEMAKLHSALMKLKKYQEADKEGRLVVLPCKVGDRLYEVTGRKTISVYKVRAIRVELFGLFIEWDIVEGFVWQSLSGINAGEIGKTVFLTREEAEKALEAMKK